MRFIASVAALVLVLMAVGVRIDAAPRQEYEVKAAFIYNFTKFIEWPVSAFSSSTAPLVINIVGRDPFEGAMERTVNGKSFDGHPFVVNHVRWGAEMRDCHLLFVSSSEKGKLGQMAELLKGAPVLTIGDTPDFSHHGGILTFFLEDNRVRFEINVEAARRARLTVSSKLLSLAKIAPSS